MVSQAFRKQIEQGVDVRPTIAVTRARLSVPEFVNGIEGKQLVPDGRVLLETGEVNVTKIAIEPVWYLPGIAERFKTDEHSLRRSLFEQTGGMFSDLVTRPDIHILLPPIGGITAYIFG